MRSPGRTLALTAADVARLGDLARIRLTDEEHAALTERAKRDERTVTAVIRRRLFTETEQPLARLAVEVLDALPETLNGLDQVVAFRGQGAVLGLDLAQLGLGTQVDGAEPLALAPQLRVVGVAPGLTKLADVSPGQDRLTSGIPRAADTSSG